MGKNRGGWKKGSLFVVFAVGFLFAGIFVSNFFQAKAASNDTGNLATTQKPTSKEIVQETKEYQVEEKERMRKQQEQALALKNKQEREKSKVSEMPTTSTTAAEPTTTNKPTPQTPTQQVDTTQSEQTNTPPPPENSSNKTVYLTFDDGPAPFSGDIIALLEKYHYKATFFMLDGNIRKYPNSVKSMVQAGETVGLHGVSHNVKTFYASVNSVLGEMDQDRATLKEISGVESFIIRTPYGSAPNMTDEYKKAVKEHEYILWDWNIDSKDWYYKDGRYVNNVITQLNRLAHHKGPIVILLHERKETLANLPMLLEYLSKQGYVSKAIDSSMVPLQFK